MPRLLDLVFSVIGLIVTAPLGGVIALAIVWDTGFPVLFTQTRVGLRGQAFRIFKFRTMRHGAAGLPLTAAGDARITRCGALLRRTRLDELPQLWNVVRGDMALVGPRPELPVFVSQFSRQYERLLQRRPGLVDPAALVFRDEARRLAAFADPVSAYVTEILPRKIALSDRYMRVRGTGTDLHLLWRALLLCFRSLLR